MAKGYRAKEPKDYRIILQQDASEPLVAHFGPVTKEGLIAASVGQLKGVPVDVYASDVDHAGGVHFNSKTWEHHSAHMKTLSCSAALQLRNALQQLIVEGTDPLHVYCEAAHANGIDYMLRVRTNDLHDVVGIWLKVDKPRTRPGSSVPELYYHTSQWKLSHPEYLMGDPTDDTHKDSYEYWERSSLNYALGPVREHFFKLIQELVNNYDLDALELDFMRFPFHFPRQERYAQRHVMTAFIGKVRTACDEAAQRRGRPIRLSVRVPDSVELCLRTGYDLPRWLNLGYLDMVTISGGYCPFGTPWHEIVSLGKAAGVPAFACINYGPIGRDRKLIYAAATRAYAQGVTGIKLWNCFYCMDYYWAPGQIPLDFSFVKDIVSPEALVGVEKAYVPGHYFNQGDAFPVAYAYDHAVWPAQMPLTVGIASDGIGNTVVLDIGDDLVSRPTEKAKLEVDLVDLGPSDELLFFFNGRQIHHDPAAWPGVNAHSKHHFEFSIPFSQIVKGENTLELRLTKREESLAPFISLSGARLTIPGHWDRLAKR